jgi:hypothetical protein
MQTRELKLKQASAILQMQPKELQNLVQFGVVRPKRRKGSYLFDADTLLLAKVAFCLKESLGTRTSILCKLMEAFFAYQEKLKSGNPEYVVFGCRFSAEEKPLKIAVPLRALGEQLRQRLLQVALYRDLPRGRKRRGWRREFLNSLTQAAKEIGEISEAEVLRTVRAHRKEKRAAEITVAAED